MFPLIAELIQLQAARTPDAIALRSAERWVTYRELNEHANQLAWVLRESGVEPETLVGLYLDRSIDAVVALLAILKSGGAYVVLDQTYPAERLKQIIESASIAYVVTSKELESEAPCASNSPTLYVDDHSVLKAFDKRNPQTVVSDHNAACVIYTSGSTGRPKGVVTEHRTLSARLTAHSHPDMIATDLCALSSPLSFGLTAARLFVPLAIGAVVDVFPEHGAFDADEYIGRLRSRAVTSVSMSPPQLDSVLEDSEQAGQVPTLRALTVGGAPLSVELAERAIEALPNVRLFSGYGSSELGTTAAMVEVVSGDYNTVSLGRPVRNTQFYLVNPDLSLVGPEEGGEICVSSPYLAREYLHDPELTGERFVVNPFDEQTQSRLFRTGDVGVYLRHGAIGFLGRVDLQLKIRGIRVEPEEVEWALKSHGSVREAVVVARDLNEDKQLVAYAVLRRDSGKVTPGELKQHLAAKLPAYMVPAWIVCLDSLPLSRAGKIDRNALPPPDGRGMT